MTSSKNGFTLIEILITITLLGIIFGISIPDFLEYRKNFRINESLQTVQTTLQKCFSSARSTTKVFAVSGEADSNEISLLLDCSNTNDSVPPSPIKLQSGVFLSNPFDVKFFPPHGDMEFVGFAEDELLLNLAIDSEHSGSIKLYKKSGLIEIIR